VHWPTTIAWAEPGGLPDDIGSGVIWGVAFAVITALYILVRNTRRRADRQYWERRDRERDLRDADPDLRKPERDG
jgi:hypothetical protein